MNVRSSILGKPIRTSDQARTDTSCKSFTFNCRQHFLTVKNVADPQEADADRVIRVQLVHYRNDVAITNWPTAIRP